MSPHGHKISSGSSSGSGGSGGNGGGSSNGSLISLQHKPLRNVNLPFHNKHTDCSSLQPPPTTSNHFLHPPAASNIFKPPAAVSDDLQQPPETFSSYVPLRLKQFTEQKAPTTGLRVLVDQFKRSALSLSRPVKTVAAHLKPTASTVQPEPSTKELRPESQPFAVAVVKQCHLETSRLSCRAPLALQLAFPCSYNPLSGEVTH